MNDFHLQPTHLHNYLVHLKPLQGADFDALFAVASDPQIWLLHPEPLRYTLPVFTQYFEGAMASGGAFAVHDAATEELIGCTRFYDHFPAESSVMVGYSFLRCSHWGGRHNQAMKTLMFDYAFQFVEQIFLFIGHENWRSRRAAEKLGARLATEDEIFLRPAEPGHCRYVMNKTAWALGQKMA